MAEIIINDVKYTNVPNKKAGTKFASALTQSNIGMSQAVQDYVNSSYFYALINAIDINWDGIDIGENTYINTTSDLIKWIESKAGDIDLSSYATVSYVNQKFEDLIGGAPETLDTLKELADALQEDASLAYVTEALEGKADKSSLTNYATNSYVTTELDKKANKSEIVQADMCETDTTSKSYVLNNPYQYHFKSLFGTNYNCYNLIIPHNTSFEYTNILNSNIRNCVIIGNYHFISSGLNSGLIQGYQNKIQNDFEVAFGQFNSSTLNSFDNSLKTVFSIGNGDSVSRHNALEVKGDGQIYIADTKAGTPYSLQSRLNSKANANDVYTKTEVDNMIPESGNLSNYVSYTNANSYYMTVEGPKQVIDSPKTFIGNKRINFRQGTSTDKLGFTLYDYDEKEVGGLEWRTNTINGKPLLSLQHYVNTANMSTIEQSYLGFRQTQGNNKYHLLAPIPIDVAKIEYISSSNYKNFFIPLVFKNGSNKVYTDCTGLVDMASLMPDLNDYTTTSYVTTELDKKADNTDIVQADMCETDTTSKSYVLNNPYQYHVKSISGTDYNCYNLVIPHDTTFYNTNILNSNTRNCVIIGNRHYISNGLNSGLIQGYENKIENDFEVAFGQFNSSTISSDYNLRTIFSIGNGSLAKKHNALEVKGNGQIYIADTEAGTPYSLQSKLNSKADANNTYTKAEVNEKINAIDLSSYVTYTDANSYYVAKEDMPDISNYISYTDANSYYAYKSDIPDMTNYVDINSYNALVARVEELASWIVSYHTPVIQDVSLWHTIDGDTIAVTYLSNNGSERRYLNISDSTTHTINFDSNVNDIVMSVDGISTGITVNNTTWPYSIQYTPSMMTEGGNYSFGFSRNMDSSYNAFSSSFAFIVESSTPEPSKQSPSASWSNTSGGTEVTVVAGDTNTVTCTFNGTPASGWTINDPGITGITVNTTTGDVSIDPTNMMSGTYYVDATYPEDSSYYYGSGQLLIRVLPSGTNPNFYYSPDSITIYNDGMTQSGNLVNNLDDPQNIQISYSSSNSSIASVDNHGNVTWVSGGSATITAEAYLISPQTAKLVATATLSVYCEVQKTTPDGMWSNLSPLGKCIVVAGDTNTVTCTFSGTPSSGWSLNDPMITGITIDSSTMSVTIDPTNMMTGNYHVYAEYPEDSSYNYNNMELLIRVLPSGSDVNFFFENDSYSLDNSTNQSMDIYIETTLGDSISWSSSDTGVCSIAQSPMSWNGATITYVSDGSATLTATIDDNGTTHTATCTVTCSSMTP